MKVPRGVVGHYDLNKSSFAEIKPILDSDTEAAIDHQSLKYNLLKENVVFILEWHSKTKGLLGRRLKRKKLSGRRLSSGRLTY